MPTPRWPQSEPPEPRGPKPSSAKSSGPSFFNRPIVRLATFGLAGLSLVAIIFVFLLSPSPKPKSSVAQTPSLPVPSAADLAIADSAIPPLANNLENLVSKGGLAVSVFLPPKGPDSVAASVTLKSFATSGRWPSGLRLSVAPASQAKFVKNRSTAAWPVILIYHQDGVTTSSGKSALNQLPQTLKTNLTPDKPSLTPSARAVAPQSTIPAATSDSLPDSTS